MRFLEKEGNAFAPKKGTHKKERRIKRTSLPFSFFRSVKPKTSMRVLKRPCSLCQQKSDGLQKANGRYKKIGIFGDGSMPIFCFLAFGKRFDSL